MRLAFNRGCSVREFEESTGADEWADWIEFHRYFDLPDAYFLAVKIREAIREALGGTRTGPDFVPYYAPLPAPRRGPSPEVKACIAFALDNVKKRKPR